MKKIRGDESNWAIIYIYMDVPLGNHLCSHLKQTKKIFFPFTKSEVRKAEQVLSGGIGTSGREEELGKGCGRVNMVQMLCTGEIPRWQLEGGSR
jgi:hypothetical protein